MRGLCCLAVLVGFACAAPARAEILIFGEGLQSARITAGSLRVSGALRVDYRGDAASGCEAAGLCAYAGTIVFEPGESGELSLVEQRRSTTLALNLGGRAVKALVRRAGAGGATNVCSDARESAFSLSDTTTRGRKVAFHGGEAVELLTTRCAGPLPSDILAALPKVELPAARVRRGNLSVDLSGQKAFAAGGLAGLMQSTVKIRVGAMRSRSLGSGRQRRRIRQVRAKYAITALSGSVRLDAAAAPDPFPCAALDACGLASAVTVAPALTKGEAELTASAPARRSRRALERALGLRQGRRPAGVSVFGYGAWSGPGTITADVQRPDGPPCHSLAPLRHGAIELAISRGRLRAAL